MLLLSEGHFVRWSDVEAVHTVEFVTAQHIRVGRGRQHWSPISASKNWLPDMNRPCVGA